MQGYYDGGGGADWDEISERPATSSQSDVNSGPSFSIDVVESEATRNFGSVRLEIIH